MPKIVIPDPFDERLRAKPPKQRGAILKTLKFLAENPRHPGLRTKGVTSWPGVFVSRVTQADRLTWHWAEGKIVLRNNCHHDDVYANP